MIPEIAVAGFIVTVLMAAFGIWKYIDTKLSQQRYEYTGKIDASLGIANLARSEVAAARLEVAEKYVTKQGMQEQTQAIMHALEGVAKRIDGLNERLDRVFEARTARRTT